MIETGDIQVIIEDGTNANLCQQIAYIKAGKTEIEEAVQEGIGDFNTNATEKTNTFNSNASAKTLAFNQNADAKTLIYDNNASNKLTAYNENATNKLADFNTNATNKTTAFDLNATSKTNDFNSNAGSKTDAFNDNYQDKKALIDAEVQVAKDWATKTDGTVDGVDYSAKYYAQSILPIKDDITAVAEIATDVSDVAEIKDEVTAVAQDKENVDAVAENITNVNTVAGDHANIQTVVNNMTAINNAPTYANNSKIWAEGLDGEVAPLGGTHSSKGWAQIAEAAASGVQNPANRDLSNLTNTGQMVIDSANGTISNCILEIPQNLKLTLENNVLTAKSGSTVVNTGETYSTLTTTADATLSIVVGNLNYNPYYVMCYGNMNLQLIRMAGVYSGSLLPENLPSNNDLFYLTTDKSIYQWKENTQTFNKTAYRYPLGIVQRTSSTAVTFAKDSNGNDMIFNGAGFIGDAIFTYPGIKGLIPNGFNADGSLRSTEFTTNSLTIITSLGSYNFHRYVVTNGGTWVVSPTLNYIKEVNRNSTGSGYWNFVAAIEFDLDVNASPKITNFTIRQPVRLATTEMLDKVQDQVDTKQETLVSGTNIKTINSTTVLGSGNFTLADQSLSNLDSTGQMVVDSQNGTISNCILEIPQNIKLTLESNVLTLKSGSILTKTGSTYVTLTTTTDKTYTVSSTQSAGKYVVLCQQGNGTIDSIVKVNDIHSGTTAQRPAFEDVSIGYKYFNTDTKQWNLRGNSAWNENWGICYPLCIIDVIDGVASFAKDSKGHDLIFNGAGFIGHHIFVYPNVKALVPDGFNENGSLKSTNATTLALNILEMRNPSYEIEYTFPVSISYMYTVARNAYRIINKFDDLIKQIGVIQFLKKSNVCYIYDDVADKFKEQNWTPFVAYNYDGTTVTQFDIQQPYEGARNLLTDDIEEQIGDIETALTTIIGA